MLCSAQTVIILLSYLAMEHPPHAEISPVQLAITEVSRPHPQALLCIHHQAHGTWHTLKASQDAVTQYNKTPGAMSWMLQGECFVQPGPLLGVFIRSSNLTLGG